MPLSMAEISHPHAQLDAVDPPSRARASKVTSISAELPSMMAVHRSAKRARAASRAARPTPFLDSLNTGHKLNIGTAVVVASLSLAGCDVPSLFFSQFQEVRW